MPEYEHRITAIEENLDKIIAPEQGALAKMHEKINKRIPWVVFWSIMLVTFMVIGGAFSYTNGVANDQVKLKENMFTKDDFSEFKTDFREFKSAVITELRSSRRSGNNDRRTP